MEKFTYTLDEYNAHNTGEMIRQSLNSGSVVINGEQVMGGVTVWGNWTLSFHTPNRTKRGTKTVYYKVGRVLNFEVEGSSEDPELDALVPASTRDSVSFGTDR